MNDKDSIWSGLLQAWGDMPSESRLGLMLLLMLIVTTWAGYKWVEETSRHNEQIREILTDSLQDELRETQRLNDTLISVLEHEKKQSELVAGFMRELTQIADRSSEIHRKTTEILSLALTKE